MKIEINANERIDIELALEDRINLYKTYLQHGIDECSTKKYIKNMETLLNKIKAVD